MHSIKKDKRYTQTLENCGVACPQWVARFCGEWISAHTSKALALEACKHAYERRMSAFTWTSGKWHVWTVTEFFTRVMLSNESTKKLSVFDSIDDVINWLFMNGEKEAARELNKAKAAI